MIGNGLSLSDIAAVTDGNKDCGFFGNNGIWAVIILAIIFGWGNNGSGFFGNSNGGATDGYILTSDFANIERKIDGVNNGLCSGFYEQARLANGTDMAMASGFAQAELARTNGQASIIQAINGIGTQMQTCCCENRYDSLVNTNATQKAISDGFCQTNFNMSSQNTQTLQAIDKVGDRIIDYMAQQNAQNLRDENFALKLTASQVAQNNYLVGQLRPAPIPAYQVQNPYCCCGQTYTGYYGTTVA